MRGRRTPARISPGKIINLWGIKTRINRTSSLASSAAGSSIGGAVSEISSKPLSSSLSSTRSYQRGNKDYRRSKHEEAWSTCVKSTLGSFPCTEQIFSQISSQPACIDNIWRGVTHEALVQFENILREHQLKLFRPHTFSWKLSARSKLSPSDHTIRVSCCFWTTEWVFRWLSNPCH